MKTFFAIAILVLAFSLRAEDGCTCQTPDSSESITATSVEEHHHGFFHRMSHAFSHTIGHGMKKGAGTVHDGIAGKSEEKKVEEKVEKIDIKADAAEQDNARDAGQILQDIKKMNEKPWVKDILIENLRKFDAKKLIGMSKDDALATIKEARLNARILRENRVTFIGTAEVNLSRINLEIDDGKVTSAKDEAPAPVEAPPQK